MALTLYTNPQSRGRIARWMLEEVGEPYEARLLDFGPGMRTPEYLAINPMAKVPALVHDGHVVTEVAAILCYLADAFPQAGLLPEDRAGFYRWMFFGAGPVEYAVTNKSMGWEAPDLQAQGRMGYGSFERVIETVKGVLASRDYLCDGRFSVVDVYLGSQVGFGLLSGSIPAEPEFQAYWDRLKDRPAARRAQETDNRLIAERKAAAHG
jgi:glutathione S-transferase